MEIILYWPVIVYIFMYWRHHHMNLYLLSRTCCCPGGSVQVPCVTWDITGLHQAKGSLMAWVIVVLKQGSLFWYDNTLKNLKWMAMALPFWLRKKMWFASHLKFILYVGRGYIHFRLTFYFYLRMKNQSHQVRNGTSISKHDTRFWSWTTEAIGDPLPWHCPHGTLWCWLKQLNSECNFMNYNFSNICFKIEAINSS